MENTQFQWAAPKTVPLTNAAFEKNNETACYWFGSATAFINSYGTTMLIDPAMAFLPGENGKVVSEYHGCEYLNLPPIDPREIEHLDAVLYTHGDDDHMGPETAKQLVHTGCLFYGTNYVKEKLIELGIPEDRIIVHENVETFEIKNCKVELTRAYHPWQLRDPHIYDWQYKLEDCCGYRIITPDGIVWHHGDTILLEEHFNNTDVDLIFADFSDSRNCYHFGRDDALKLFNHLHQADLIIQHCGSVYVPEHRAFNGNPTDLAWKLIAPERLHILGAGEKFVLRRKTQ